MSNRAILLQFLLNFLFFQISFNPIVGRRSFNPASQSCQTLTSDYLLSWFLFTISVLVPLRCFTIFLLSPNTTTSVLVPSQPLSMIPLSDSDGGMADVDADADMDDADANMTDARSN